MAAALRFILGAAALCLAFAKPALADEAAPVAEMRPGVLAGYLKPSDLPDSLALLPPPPALGSAAEALDEEVARDALTLRDTDRFKLAALDADLSFPGAAGTFSCVLGIPLTPEDTPTLYRLLRRVMADAGGATRREGQIHARPPVYARRRADLPALCRQRVAQERLLSFRPYVDWLGLG
jgi:acid phosphatase (class A)